ncbi:MAG: aminotransferase class I/II-fold pyridoxal phosphate-dependent enzyme [Saprospiraceae bacterium]|nr:aminotransferase class I/II-fold pyridoxal phosphate-dependent enzyme [Saprospiraceae bacterium]
MINLISDTVTKPTPEMLEAMFRAEVGDDVFGEDPTINKLERKVADLFGKENALFCPSGTMTNQIALQIHTDRLTEIICEETSHVYQSETSGYAYNARAGVHLIRGEFGKINSNQVEEAIQPNYDWVPKSAMVVLENTTNKGGGNFYTLDEIRKIKDVCRKNNLKLHLDGARLFNALVETNESTFDFGQEFDTISVCMSKGLGAPVGSLLIGDNEQIKRARRLRKVMGGGMRQAGYLAAACIFALDHNIDRLKEDHDKARLLGSSLQNCNYVEEVLPVKTNIVIARLSDDVNIPNFLNFLKSKGILATQFGKQIIRFVTHLDVSNTQIEQVTQVLFQFKN